MLESKKYAGGSISLWKSAFPKFESNVQIKPEYLLSLTDIQMNLDLCSFHLHLIHNSLFVITLYLSSFAILIPFI